MRRALSDFSRVRDILHIFWYNRDMPEAKKRPAPKLVGKVTHYFDNIGVAVVKFSSSVKKGDTLLIEGGENSFTQKLGSMENDHKKVATAKKGDEFGLKVSKKAHEGYRVYKK